MMKAATGVPTALLNPARRRSRLGGEAAGAGGGVPPLSHTPTLKQPGKLVQDFLPELVIRHIAERHANGKPLMPPAHDHFTSVALFADLSGFTVLSESLAVRSGGLGAEHLGFWLNRYFELLVKLVQKAGGDVFKFAGDALVALWPPELRTPPTDATLTSSSRSVQTPSGGSGVDLERMMRRAIQCALHIQAELHDAQFAKGIRFSIKIGIGVGFINVLYVGGLLGRMECLATGEALSQAFKCEAVCDPGQVVVSAPVWSVVKPSFVGRSLPSGHVMVRSMLAPLPSRHLKRTPLLASDTALSKQLLSYVPAAIVPHLASDLHAWSSELRTITVLFVNLGFQATHLQSATPAVLSQVQEVMLTVQRNIYAYEGSLNKFLVDDKGSTVLAVFGLPPLAHEDDPERAVLTAIALAKALRDMKMECYMGVTTGVALCGPVGSGNRREYSVLGDVVNTGARLMQLVPSVSMSRNGTFHGCIVTDRATKESAESNPSIVFEALEATALKGKADLVHVWQPGLLHDAAIPISVLWQPEVACVEAGFAGLHSNLLVKVRDMLSGDYIPGLVVVAGDTGYGKTALMKHVVLELQQGFGAAIAVPMPVENGDLEQLVHDPNLTHYFANVNSIFADDYSPPVLEPTTARRTSSRQVLLTASIVEEDNLSTSSVDTAADAAPAGSLRRVPIRVRSSVTPVHRLAAAKSMQRVDTPPREDDQLYRSLLVPTPSPRAVPPRFDAGMTRPRSFRLKEAGSMSSLVPPSNASDRMSSPLMATPRRNPSLLDLAPPKTPMRSTATAPPGGFAAGFPASAGVEEESGVFPSPDMDLDGLGIKYPLRVLYATGEVFKENERCFLWRQIVHQLTSDLEFCFTKPDMHEVVKLVNIIRRRHLFQQNMDPEDERFEVPVLLRLLVLHCVCVPVVMLLDECHHATERDWELTLAVAEMLANEESLKCVAVVGTRPLHEAKHQPNFRSTPPAYYSVLSLLTTEYWSLQPMNREDIDAMVQSDLDVPSIPYSFSKLVHNMSGGNPLLVKKFVQALMSVGLVRVTRALDGGEATASVMASLATPALPSSARLLGALKRQDTSTLELEPQATPRQIGVKPARATLTVDIGSTMFLPVPYKIQRLIARDLNRLNAVATVALKTASVLCMGGGQAHLEFDLGLLRVTFPTDRGRALSTTEMEATVDTLIQFGFRFMSGMLRDVVYHRVLHAQRRRLHRTAANLLEGATNGTSSHAAQSIPSQRELYKHLYRHLELSGQHDKAREVFDDHLRGTGRRGGAGADASPLLLHVLSPPAASGGGADPSTMPRTGLVVSTSDGSARAGACGSFSVQPSPAPSTNTSPAMTPIASNCPDEFVEHVLDRAPKYQSPGSQSSNEVSLYGDDDDAGTEGNTSRRHDGEGGPLPRLSLWRRLTRRLASLCGGTAPTVPVMGTPSPLTADSGSPAARASVATAAQTVLSAGSTENGPGTARSGAASVPALPLDRVIKRKESRHKTSQGFLKAPFVRVGSFSMRPSRLSMPSMPALGLLDGEGEDNASNGSGAPPRAPSGAHNRKSSVPIIPSSQSFVRAPSSVRSARSHEDDAVNLSARRRTSFLQHLQYRYGQPASSPALVPEAGAHPVESVSPTQSLRRSWVASPPPARSRKASLETITSRGTIVPVRRGASDSMLLAITSPTEAALLSPPPAPTLNPDADRSEQLVRCLRGIDSWEFDVLFADRLMENAALMHVSKIVIRKRKLESRLGLPSDRLMRFIGAVQVGYSVDNPFTNSIHAADVVQCCHILLSTAVLVSFISPLEELAVLVAAMVHDFRHPGVTTKHLVATKHAIVVEYGDDAPLERYHVAEAFALLEDNSLDCNFMEGWDTAQEATFRAMVTSIVLGTAGGQFPRTLALMTRLLDDDTLDARHNEDHRLQVLRVVVMAADVSHCARPFATAKQWFSRATAELHQQGDLELEHGLPVSPFMDRRHPAVAASQSAFISGVAAPVLGLAGRLFPSFRDMVGAPLNEGVQFWERNPDPGSPPAGVVDSVASLFL